jgi:nicotinate phosphoribosyltransferase
MLRSVLALNCDDVGSPQKPRIGVDEWLSYSRFGFVFAVTCEKGSQTNMTTAQKSLFMDRYELTMLDGALASGLIDAKASYEVFTRSLPNGYRYGIVGGTGRFLEELSTFTFDEATLSWLIERGIISRALREYLADYHFGGDVFGHREGEVFTEYCPILRIEGKFADIVLETLALSILNFDSGVATKAMRVVRAAQGRRLIVLGSRRAHEYAAISAARAAYVAGFDATSNLAAGWEYGIPTAGTAAHSFTLAHRTEREAFDAQVASQGPRTTLLVDTFDTAVGTATALEVAGPELGAVRIDSGDLVESSRDARRFLDDHCGSDVKITLTGDLNEFVIADVLERGASVDTFGVGTSLVAGYMPPGFVFKLVEIQDGASMRPVAKRSIGKISAGGAKDCYRQFEGGIATTELIVARGAKVKDSLEKSRTVTHQLVDHGSVVTDTSVGAARAMALKAVGELPEAAFDLEPSGPVLLTKVIANKVTSGNPRK